MTGSCVECVFWDAHGDESRGLCRRYAPGTFGTWSDQQGKFAGWPLTSPHAWCGEFELDVLDAEIVDDDEGD